METIAIEAIEITKKGNAAIWETGGGLSNTGYCRLVCGPNGQKLVAICQRQRCNDGHALFKVHENDCIIHVSRHRDEININLYQIKSIDLENKLANLEQIGEFSNGEWDIEPSPEIDAAVKAAVKKSYDYHCRRMYWGESLPSRY